MLLKEAIANRIEQLCTERAITPYALARICGIDTSTIYSILGTKSNRPEVATIKKICDGLEITIAEFFDTETFNSLEQEIK
ncbi:MAG: helix-turn-helix transcriptional regulator [Clostridia bacterium]|nr:helix-turn-helix transcriptional regulator [Clostridia bacterium]